MTRSAKLRLLAASVGLLLAAPVSAAELQVNGSGQLTGATGVNVNGTLYDVTFVEGMCSSLFNGCDDLSDFTFDQAGAYSAAQALLDQVFVDGPDGDFDSSNVLTFGCSKLPFELSPPSSCSAYVPYASDGSTSISAAFSYNSLSNDYVAVSPVYFAFDSSTSSGAVWAVFSPAALPEPSTWALMILGFGAIGLAARAGRKANNLPQLA